MKLLDTIKDNFARGYFSKAMEVTGLPSEYLAWTIKQEQWIGVAVPLPRIIEFSEHFANVRLYTETNVAISNKEYNLLILIYVMNLQQYVIISLFLGKPDKTESF